MVAPSFAGGSKCRTVSRFGDQIPRRVERMLLGAQELHRFHRRAFRRQVKSLQLHTLSEVTLRETGGGRGTVTLGSQPGWSAWYRGMAWPGMADGSFSPALEGIEHAREVYALIQDTQRRAGN